MHSGRGSLSYDGTIRSLGLVLPAEQTFKNLPSELGVFDWLTHVQASPLTYLAVLGACAFDAVLPVVPSEAVVIAASILATRGKVGSPGPVRPWSGMAPRSLWWPALSLVAGTATTFTAAMVRLPWPRFAAADAVGASLWAAYAAGLGYLGGETFERRPLSAFLFGLGVALLFALLVEVARRLRRHGAQARGRGVLGWRSER
jgi:membrane-associated protein